MAAEYGARALLTIRGKRDEYIRAINLRVTLPRCYAALSQQAIVRGGHNGYQSGGNRTALDYERRGQTLRMRPAWCYVSE